MKTFLNKRYHISIILFGIGLLEIVLTWSYNVIFFVIGLWIVTIEIIGMINMFFNLKKETKNKT